MKNKICIITGATSGIGLASAAWLAGKGATLGLVCRNKIKGEKIIQMIKENTKNSKIELFVADLSSQAEIRRVADEIKAKFPVTDVLINNAGAINPKRTTTADGLETTFAVNHLAYFLLTNLLLGNLEAAHKARIVNIASQAAIIGKMRFDDLQTERRYRPMKAYSQSKLANILFTFELSERLKGTGITANCVYPGIVKTRFGKDLRGFWGILFKKMGGLLRTAEKGAETVIWLASAPGLEETTGKYFKDKKEIKTSFRLELQKKLWAVSEDLTELK